MLIDFRRAFDSVPHGALFSLIEGLGYDRSTCELLRGLYRRVRCFPVVHGDTGLSFVLQRGIRQGCPVSPSLFALYLEPLARWVKLHHPKVPALLYADDLAFLVIDKEQARAILHTIYEAHFTGLTATPRLSL